MSPSLQDAALPASLSAAPQRRQSSSWTRISVIRDLATVADTWRELERTALATPYQRFGWVAAFADTIARAAGEEIITIVAEDEAGRPVMLMPLAARRRHGVRVAEIVGGKHANFHMPLFAPEALATLSPAACRRLLIESARAARIDVLALVNQPLAWQGVPNPVATLGGKRSPSRAFKRELSFAAKDTLSVLLSSESRKKLRKKERRLGEIGPITYGRAETEAEVDAVLGAFFEQKATRFRDMGIDNPFADPAAQAFLRRAALSGLERGQPAIELHALRVGETILATFGGAADGRRFCGMINSFSTDPELARSSPGELLLFHVIATQCDRGLETFDLGVGEAAYKTAVCDEVEELADVFLPANPVGRLYAHGVALARQGKGWAKGRPWVMQALHGSRRLRAR